MKGMLKVGIVAIMVSTIGSVFAQEEETTGAVGWTPVAVSLASPVQLPYGIGEWDVFGLDFGIFYNDVCKMYGAQFSCANTTRADVKGFAAGGFFNYACKNVYGVRATLGANLAWDGALYGADFGGFGFHKDVYGFDAELAGGITETLVGCQAGLVVAIIEKELCGVTVVGGASIATTVYGCQLSGVFNQTDELHGAQIGLVNIARECPWGFQIGLINVIMDNKVKVLPVVNGYF